jgi:antitoxin component YwqK of YwqJK toxin-antitoxin module
MNHLKKNWLFFILILIVGYTYQIRSFGLALLVGIAVFLAVEKRWKYVSTLVGGFILLALPWYIRSKRLGGNAYINQLLQKNPYRPELGKMGFADWFTRFWHNLERYITREIPNGTFDFIRITNYKQPLTAGEWIFGIVVIAVMIYGLFRLKKYFRLFLFYLIASFGILLLWPDVWVGTRFMLPLIPLLTFLFINGIIELISLFGFNVLKIKSQRAIYLVLVGLSLLTINSYGKKAIYLREMQAKSPFPKPYQSYFELAEWIKRNAPANSVTCCRKQALFYLYSGKYVTGFANTEDVVKEIEYLEKRGTDYVVLDHLGYSSTARYLYPAIQRFPNKFKVIKHIKSPDTYLFKFEPKMGYWGHWKNGERDGFGTFRWANGMKFEGMWKNNLRNGKGILLNPNGQRLEGFWKNDKLNGTAIVKSRDGQTLELIVYKDNKPVKVFNRKKSH